MTPAVTRLARIRDCRRGGATVEFALLAPAFFMMLFGIIEGGRMIWTQQTIAEVAFSTVRCMSVDTACALPEDQRDHAIARALDYGLTVGAADVTPEPNATCTGLAAANAVTIRLAFDSPVAGLMPGLPASLTARACYPLLSAGA